MTRDVPHRGRRKFDVWPEVDRGQAFQKWHRAALGHSCIAINHQVLVQSLLIRLVAKEGQSNSPIASKVLDLLVQSQMAHDELFAVNADPHYGHLRTAVGIERGQMSEGTLSDHFSYGFRNPHARLSFKNGDELGILGAAVRHPREGPAAPRRARPNVARNG